MRWASDSIPDLYCPPLQPRSVAQPCSSGKGREKLERGQALTSRNGAYTLTLQEDGNKYQQIADASGISNPDLIHPGQVLTVP